MKDDAGVPVCVTGTQLKSLLTGSVLSASSQSAAGTSPTVGTDTEAPDGSSASEVVAADNATTTTPAEVPSTPEAANDNPQSQGAEQSSHDDNQSVAQVAAEGSAPELEADEPEPKPELEAANDNSPVKDLPATGTE